MFILSLQEIRGIVELNHSYLDRATAYLFLREYRVLFQPSLDDLCCEQPIFSFFILQLDSLLNVDKLLIR